MNKTQWLDWIEASADRLQQRYRDAWNRAPRAPRTRRRPQVVEPVEEPRRWSAIHPEIEREDREVVVHLELPEPHTVEADVRVINDTLSIAVLKTGSDIARASAADCYRRSIPLPPEVDPTTATHKVHGNELIIRMLPQRRRQRRQETGEEQEAVAEAAEAQGAPEGAGERKPARQAGRSGRPRKPSRAQ